MNNEVYDYEREIDLLQLWRILWQRWWVIALFILVGFAIGTGYVYGFKDDVYTANSSMIVQVNDSTDSEYTDLLTGQRLVDTYAEIATSNRVLNELEDTLGMPISSEELRCAMNVTGLNDTLIIKLNVTCSNPEKAQLIANQTIYIVQRLSHEFEGLDTVEILDVAELPTSPSGPNHMLYMIIGILLGGMTGVGIVLLLEYLDNHVKTVQDLEQKVGVRVLAAIPDYTFDEVDKNAGL